MPTDPIYNPQLPSTPAWNPSSSAVDSHASWPAQSGMHRSSALTSLSAGFIAGAVTGAAIALMFAPRRGTELRGSLRQYASDGGERVSRMVQSGRTRAGDAVHRASSLIEQGRDALRSKSRSGSMSASAPASQPLTASVAEISGVDRRFEEPLGG